MHLKGAFIGSLMLFSAGGVKEMGTVMQRELSSGSGSKKPAFGAGYILLDAL